MKKLIWCMVLMVGVGSVLVFNWPEVQEEKVDVLEGETKSIFISYIELSKYLNGKSVDVSKDNIKMMVTNVKEMGFNEIILQVRSFADAIYESKIFPWSRMISSEEGINPGYDALEVFIEIADSLDISIIAWINPYRIRNYEDVSDLSEDSPAFKYLNSDVVYISNGVYFNPSKEVVTKLIVDGVEELVSNYKIDGVLFDDYFYPDNEIDRKDYDEYIENNEYITKEQYNLNIISAMIREVHEVCQKYNVKFGVSPDGNMGNNYNKVFADVKKWCSEDGYIDFIMPQIYYGFFNETKAFKKVVDEWESVVSNEKVDLRVALAFYKVGTEDKWAKTGMYEWLENDDIIMREIMLSRNLDKYEGFALFRYDYLFNEDMFTNKTMGEIENIKKVIN